jgi:hypothetical protein
LQFSISNVLLIIAIILFATGAFTPLDRFAPADLWQLAWSFVLASFLLDKGKG